MIGNWVFFLSFFKSLGLTAGKPNFNREKMHRVQPVRVDDFPLHKASFLLFFRLQLCPTTRHKRYLNMQQCEICPFFLSGSTFFKEKNNCSYQLWLFFLNRICIEFVMVPIPASTMNRYRSAILRDDKTRDERLFFREKRNSADFRSTDRKTRCRRSAIENTGKKKLAKNEFRFIR